MRQDLMAAIILSAAVAANEIRYERPKEREPTPQLPDNFLIRPQPEVTSTKRAYLGEVVHVRVKEAEAEAVIKELREKRLARNRKKLCS